MKEEVETTKMVLLIGDRGAGGEGRVRTGEEIREKDKGRSWTNARIAKDSVYSQRNVEKRDTICGTRASDLWSTRIPFGSVT